MTNSPAISDCRRKEFGSELPEVGAQVLLAVEPNGGAKQP
jgi:hypothetical protein